MSQILSVKWDVGAHMPFSTFITPTLIQAIDRGMYSCQFFMGNPKSYKRQRIAQKDFDSSREILTHFPLHVFTHFPYIANLNGSVKSLAWDGDKMIDGKMKHMLGELEYEINTIAKLNTLSNGVVIHPGCYPDRPVGLDTIAKSINKISFDTNSKLLLENCAGEGRKLCKNFEELKRVIDSVDPSKKNNVGVCVDTAHIWGEGDYDLRRCDEVDRLFHDVDKNIGLGKFNLLHLNDSEVPLGAKKDRHACLGTGFIWGESFDSLTYLLNKCKENNIPMILETNEVDMLTLSNM